MLFHLNLSKFCLCNEIQKGGSVIVSRFGDSGIPLLGSLLPRAFLVAIWDGQETGSNFFFFFGGGGMAEVFGCGFLWMELLSKDSDNISGTCMPCCKSTPNGITRIVTRAQNNIIFASKKTFLPFLERVAPRRLCSILLIGGVVGREKQIRMT